MLAYNDFTVTALLLNQENHTMVPKIQSYLGTNQHEGNLMWAVSAVVSATAPLFMLVMFFQRHTLFFKDVNRGCEQYFFIFK